MKTKHDFESRILEAVAECDGVRCNQGRFLRAQKRLRAVEAVLYTDNDLRGLSATEKRFIRENGMKCYIDVLEYYGTTRYYLFVARDFTTGKRRLYAYSKRQWLNPNGHDVSASAYNYECYLLVAPMKDKPVSRFDYERRFCSGSLAPIFINI